jgi:hypothetical protein
MGKKIKIIQITKFESAIRTVKFLQSEKIKDVRLLRREDYCKKDKRTRRHYAVCIIVPKNKEVIGRPTRLVDESELIVPGLFFKVIYL